MDGEYSPCVSKRSRVYYPDAFVCVGLNVSSTWMSITGQMSSHCPTAYNGPESHLIELKGLAAER